MKGQIEFENVADQLLADMQDKQYRAKAWDRKKHWSKDSRYSIWERIGIIFGCFTFVLAAICFLAINGEAIDSGSEKAIHYLNDLSTGAWTVIVLIVMLCVLGVWAKRRGK